DVIKQRLENDTTIKHIITISPENAEPLHLRKEARKIAFIKDMRKGHGKYPDAHIMCYK
ncbi:MAG: hypothetical protein HZB65_04005, partial [Candidatus Aenigmarchaeota archaeon]|nr:hypothetical protein [Candidatus Aenigmarchaeota archaeon]